MLGIVLTVVGWGLGGFVTGNLGFGAALVAMPFVVMGNDMRLAVPACSLLVLALNIQMAWSYRRHLVWTEAVRMLAGALTGAAVGVLLLRWIPEAGLETGLGFLLLFCAAWGPVSRRLRCKTIGTSWGMLAGFLSTSFGTAFGINGPPPAAYLSLRQGSQQETKAVLGFFFVWSSSFVVAAQAVAGLFSVRVIVLAAVGLPVMLLGCALGIRLSARLKDAGFHRGMSLLLLVMGINLLYLGLS